MFRKRFFWIGLVVALALAGGGFGYYRYVYLPDQEPEEDLMTAAASRGDLIISVSGTGVLHPASERELGFQSQSGEDVAGYLDEVLVEVGDQVEKGDLLARLEDEELEFAVLKAYIDLRAAQFDLADVTEAATEAELFDARADLESAQLALRVAQLNYENAQKSSRDADVRDAQIAVQHHAEETQELSNRNADQQELSEAWSARQEAEAAFDEALQEAKMEDLEAWNQVDQARNSVLQAKTDLESLESGPDREAVLQGELRVDRAELALQEARDDLDAATLRAPFAGTVVDVSAVVGQRVGNTTIVTLADLKNPVVQFWVEESDAGEVEVGNRVEIEFEALPERVFHGEVSRIDPALVTVENYLAVQGWGSLNLSGQDGNLLGDMNADVEIIGAETHDVVLVPIQALREIGDGQYAVFVVQDDGELEMRPVEVGLQDAVNAEIVSGLKSGEVVSLGQSSATSATSGEEGEMPGPGQVMPAGGLFGSGGGPGGGPPGGGR